MFIHPNTSMKRVVRCLNCNCFTPWRPHTGLCTKCLDELLSDWPAEDHNLLYYYKYQSR